MATAGDLVKWLVLQPHHVAAATPFLIPSLFDLGLRRLWLPRGCAARLEFRPAQSCDCAELVLGTYRTCMC